MKNSELLLLIVLLATAPSQAIQVAVTFDDLPAAGDEVPGKTRREIANQIIATLKAHGIERVYGFANAILAKNMEERLKIMADWKAAGHLVGNHTYGHKDLAEMSAEAYISEQIEPNEPFLSDYASAIEEYKVFRFPYLSEGETVEKRYAIRSYLKRRKYIIAPVTIDFEDWSFGATYVRCLIASNPMQIAEVESTYLSNAIRRLEFSDRLFKTIYGEQRQLKHILLLHMTGLTAKLLDTLLTLYEKEGVAWVSLENALKDPVYFEDTSYIGKGGKTFLIQGQETRKLGLGNLRQPAIPREKLESMCK